MFLVTGPVTSSTSAWRGDEAQAEALEIVKGVVQRMDLELAGIAGPGIDLADGEAAAKLLPRHTAEICRQLRQGSFVGRWWWLRQAPARYILEEKPSHACLLEVVARIGAVERFVA